MIYKNLPFEFNKKYNFVRDGENYIKLTSKESEILDILLSCENNVCNYDNFNVNMTVLRVCVSRINKKLKNYLKITAITNEGYMLIFYTKK